MLREEICGSFPSSMYIGYSQEEASNVTTFGFVRINSLPEDTSYVVSVYRGNVSIAARRDYVLYFKAFTGVMPSVFRDKIVEDPMWLNNVLQEKNVESKAENRRFLNEVSKILCGESFCTAKDTDFYLVSSAEQLEKVMQVVGIQ